MSRPRSILLLFALLATTLASCTAWSSRRSWIDWRWPVHVQEERQAWEDATGRKLQYANGGSPLF